MRRTHVYKNQACKNVMDHFYTSLLQRNPLTATWLGEHEYDGLLPEIGAEAVEKDIATLRGMKTAVEGLGEREMSLDERLDRQVVLTIIRRDLFLLEDAKRWKLGRDLAMDIGDALFALYVRDFAPLAQRVEAMISRLKAAPVYLQSGRNLFQSVPALWGEIFLESAEQLPELLTSIEAGIKGRIIQPLFQHFTLAATELKRALDQHIRWFKNAILPNAHGDWAMGTGPFQALMGLRNLGMSLPEMIDLGEQTLRSAHSRMETIAHQMTGGAHVREAAQKLKAKAPRDFALALATYQDAVARSRAFVELHDFATLPGEETLEIMETPGYLAHVIPFAAYIAPERHARPQKGIYLVTRPPKGADLSRHCYADISNTSIHEGYPGHHLQLAGQNLHPSRVRLLAESIELIEGWAHYCEEEAKRRGFEDTDENRFAQASDESLRAARVLIDIHIHQKTWTFDQGLDCLLRHTDMDRASALAEMKRYTQFPGYQLSYLVGKHLLMQQKEDLKKAFGPDFSDKLFHNLVVYEGSIPLGLAREFYPAMMKEALRGQSTHSQGA
jgi:uncharacterized protein (DUF885 family)